LYHEAAGSAVYAVDLHNGGNPLYSPGFVIFPQTNDETEQSSRELCSVTGLPHAVGVDVNTLEGSLSARLAADGIPAILTETGGEGRLRERDYQSVMTLLENLISHLDILEIPIESDTTCSFHEGFTILSAQSEGFFESDVEGNEFVEAEETLGQVTDIFGETHEVFTAPYDAVVVGTRTYGNASPGDWVFELTPR
jgi:predicted deacylase